MLIFIIVIGITGCTPDNNEAEEPIVADETEENETLQQDMRA